MSNHTDELKVYTGKETLQALLEGKILKHGWNGHHYKIVEDKLLSSFEGGTFGEAAIVFSNLMETEFTEVAVPQVGDWVKVKSITGISATGVVTQVIDDRVYGKWNEESSEETYWLNRDINTWEILSPEQVSEYKREQAFVKLGRKLNEFKHGDIVYIDALAVVATVVSNQNDLEIRLHGINATGHYTAKPHQLTPIAFTEQQVDLS